MTSPYCERCGYTLTDHDLDDNDKLLCVACEYEDLIDPGFTIGFTLESVSGGAAYVLRQLSGTICEIQFADGSTLEANIEDASEEDGLRVYDFAHSVYREFPWANVKKVTYL